jgi:hypothetical protein
LFAYGDKDGKGLEARLQHPLGVIVARKNGGSLEVFFVKEKLIVSSN